MDVSDTIQAKSDQLNADDLLGGPIVVSVERVTRGADDQPVHIHTATTRPYRPCKSMRRVLVAAWGADASTWVGRQMELYRDPAVRWGGAEVGGIRISRLSHIPRPIRLSLAVSRGKKAAVQIGVIEAVTLDGVLGDATLEQLDAWRAARDRGPISELTDDQRAQLAAWLAADPSRVAAVAETEVSP